MQLVEKHLVRSSNANFLEIEWITFHSKNLYNAANYIMRQHFFDTGNVYGNNALYHIAKHLEEYSALPRKVSQQTLKVLSDNWKSWVSALREYRKAPEKFNGKPKIPKYLDKNGRFVAVYTDQAISFRDERFIRLSGTNIYIETQVAYEKINQVRVIPKGSCYVIEVVYTVEPEVNCLDYSLVAGIDLGLNNLATVASNKAGHSPFFVNGRPIKALNQFYNKQRAYFQAKLPNGVYNSKRLQKITEKRNRRVDHYMHIASRLIVNYLVYSEIGNLVIGKNDGWKQKINIGNRNNQNFVSIPHARFIGMLTYKAELAGIVVFHQEESYTSKCSFLDMEPISKHANYAGKRISRGLFRASSGALINADVNGAYNIIRKAFPKAFDGIGGVVVHPVRINLRT